MVRTGPMGPSMGAEAGGRWGQLGREGEILAPARQGKVYVLCADFVRVARLFG